MADSASDTAVDCDESIIDVVSECSDVTDSLVFSETEPADTVVDDAPASTPDDGSALSDAASAYPQPKAKRQRRRMQEERLRVRRRLNLHAKHNPGVIVPRVTPPVIDVDDTILDSGASPRCLLASM